MARLRGTGWIISRRAVDDKKYRHPDQSRHRYDEDPSFRQDDRVIKRARIVIANPMRTKWYLGGVVLLVVGYLLGWGMRPGIVTAPTVPTQSEKTNASNVPAAPEKPQTVSVMIDFGDGNVQTFRDVEMRVAKDVFAVTKMLSQTGKGFVFQYQPPGQYGILVDQIGNKKGGDEGGKYWLFWVNNVMAEQAADRTSVSPGDVIEWKFINLKMDNSTVQP